MTTSGAELYNPDSGLLEQHRVDVCSEAKSHSSITFNGSVLVVGGNRSGATLASSEIYNPVTTRWSTTGSSRSRYDHTATLLKDGRVLVAGGTVASSQYIDSAELLRLMAGTWSYTASLLTTRTNHTATLLKDGRVIVVCGYNTNTGTIVVRPAIHNDLHTYSFIYPLILHNP